MKTFNKIKIVSIVYCMILPHLAMASLDGFFKSLGVSANVSSPAAFNDQAAGYYTGGGLMMRQKNRSYQPINISPPSFGAGCSGIDAYFGSISFMSGDALVKMIRQMGTTAGTYALQLGLKTMAPQIENLLSQLRKLALDANALMMGDCRQVQQIFAATLPKGSAFQEHACIDATKGGGEDWFGAKEACKKPEKMAAALEKKQTDSPDLMVNEFNLTWHILKKLAEQRYLTKEDMEFWLTMVGTVVNKREGTGPLKPTFYTGKAADEATWTNLVKGGEISGLSCEGDEDKCLSMKRKTIEIKESLGDKIEKQINKLQEKYLGKAVLDDTDIAFLNNVADLPLWKYIQVLAAHGGGGRYTAIYEYVALRILLSQLDRIVSEVDGYMHLLQDMQMEAEKIKEYREHLNTLKNQLRQRQGPMTQQTLFQFNQMVESYEKHVRLMHSLSN
jgi:conjugative transfer pilus assembly protein TraH